MGHPQLFHGTAAEMADDIASMLREVPIQRVLVNDGLAHPEDAFGHGGMTTVPFITCAISGRARLRVRDGGREHDDVLGPGVAVVHCPESYARAIYETPGSALRFTCDTDHLLCGHARCVDPDDLDSGVGFPPMRAWVHPTAVGEPATALLRLVMASEPAAQAQRCAWLTAWCWLIHDRLRAAQGGGADATWLAMRAWLDERAHLPIGRDDCARAFGVHPNHVARVFRQQGGCSFTGCLLDLRMERALILLRDAGRPVADVARACGFGDSAYFVRRFRERYGKPPGRWRRERIGAS